MDQTTPQLQDPFAPPKKTVPKGPILAAVIGLVVLIVIMFGFVSAWKHIADSRSDSARVQSVIDGVAQQAQICADAADPERCRALQVEEGAKSAGSVQVCALLEGVLYDSCVFELAQITQDVEVCVEIQDEVRRGNCLDGEYLQLALATSDASFCKKIRDEEEEAGCSRVVERTLTQRACADPSNTEQSCADYRRIDDARVNKDPDICAGVSDESLKVECYDSVGAGDRDFDGLDEEQEAFYGTSDRNADSDGDGFDDGVEVENGYNPAGEGRLDERE